MKKFLTSLWEIIREELIFIIVLILLFFILKLPVNYYIVTGGGTSDVSSRIAVEDPFPKKGSFNIVNAIMNILLDKSTAEKLVKGREKGLQDETQRIT